MSNRKLAKNFQRLFNQARKLYRQLTTAFVNWLLRTALLLNRRPRSAGFVLPTAVFLILVVTLTTGALTFRSFNSTTRTIGNVQSRQIYNAATPAIDRARSKLDYLFSRDKRLPSGIPAEEIVISMLLNDGRPIGTAPAEVSSIPTGGVDPYTFSNETRVDINGDGLLDNAWVYKDENTNSSVVYSITLSTPDVVAGDTLGPLKLLQLTDKQKADGNDDGPFARTGPLSNSEAVSCRVAGAGSTVEGGWYQDQTNTSILRKRFQVDAFVVGNDTINNGRPLNFTTLEFAQDRKVDRGNKWGAWFKYDLEVTPGAKLNWNGAMHSEGSILIGRSVSATSGFSSYLISSPNSCLFRPASNSEMSARKFEEQNGNPAKKFFGIIGAGDIRSNDFSGNSEIHTYNGSQPNNINPGGNFSAANDWKVGGAKGTLDALATDPKVLLTRDIQQAIAPDITNQDTRISEAAIANNLFTTGERFFVTETNTQPYVDDTYRADNRYGPKVRYKNELGDILGKDIPTSNAILTGEDGTGGKEVGLDGYWERRTFKDSETATSKVYTGGMRILVGERLELGNPFGWQAPQNKPDTPPTTNLYDKTPYPEGADGETGNVSTLKTSAFAPTTTIATVDPSKSDVEGDPLYPPYAYTGTANTDRQHEAKQRRALRDNPAAVQAAAVYHYRLGETTDGRTPAACLALTAHPGSPYTLRQSVNFKPYSFNGGTEKLVTDFFAGKGTNGWEFEPPTVAQLQGGALRQALLNLANFAGDPDGAFPPKQEAGKIHPDPILTMWGNFSNLRRALTAGNNSPADQSYLQTAGCAMGMLAYNINQIQKFSPSANSNQAALESLGGKMFGMMNGNVGDTDGEVLSKDQLATYGYSTAGTLDLTKYNPRDYDRVTPDMFLAKLQQNIRNAGVSTDPENDPQYQLAQLIHEHFQIRRDRTYGFRPSPAANTWNYNPFALEMPGASGGNAVGLWSSACDPNIFKVSATPAGSNAASAPSLAAPGGAIGEAHYRLALSRLCGEVIPAGNLQDLKPSLGDNNYPVLGDSANNANLPTPNQTYYPTLPTGESVNADFVAPNLRTAVGTNNDLKRATVAPKFPSLYYIFPEISHGHAGSPPSGIDDRQPGESTLYTGGTALPIAYQPWKEPYITQVSVNGSVSYDPVSTTQAVAVDPAYSITYDGTSNSSKLPTGAPNPAAINSFTYSPFLLPVEDKSVEDAALPPRATLSDWVQPTIAAPADTDPNPNRIIDTDGAIAAIPFQDKVMFNGREWLPSRVLDVDLGMLRTSNKGVGNDTWLPASGIVYAFREDAVREDNIARPANTLGYTNAQDPTAETDPAKDTAVPPESFGVSIKPVDFIPDPDRRPHAFRLRNGAILKREGGPDDKNNFRGLSFITDQPAYIMGDFNLHQATPGGTRLEEFTELLPDDPTQYSEATFYTNRKTRDTNFANPDKDLWRPSEVLADTVIMLSDQFCDGSVIDTFMTAGSDTPNSRLGIDSTNTFSGNNFNNPANATKNVYTFAKPGNPTVQGGKVYDDPKSALYAPGCQNNATDGATSFLNQNRPNKDLTGDWNWVRENPGDTIYSPVKISRNGNGLIAQKPAGDKNSVPIEYSSANDTGVNGAYYTVVDGTNRARGLQFRGTEGTTMNAILISNIIPSRANQQNGALNNFPRFLEDWNDSKAKLRFAGSFLQLGFSNYATAPFDQDRWEPSGTTITSGNSEYTSFFRPPARLWGYDVALQLAQASPAANRFTTASSEKNEFYTEPAANDPYMQNLCGALKANAPTGLDATKLNCPT